MADRAPVGRSPYSETNLFFEDDAVFSVETMPGQHVQQILDFTQSVQANQQFIPSRRLGRPAATIDMVTRAQWRKEWQRGYADRMKWGEFLVMKLNSSDYSKLRTGVRRL